MQQDVLKDTENGIVDAKELLDTHANGTVTIYWCNYGVQAGLCRTKYTPSHSTKTQVIHIVA